MTLIHKITTNERFAELLKRLLLLAAAGAALSIIAASSADAADVGGWTNQWARNYANTRPWHGGYSYTPYAMPTALVVPPNSHMETVHSWGVSQNLMYPIYHQYGRNAPSYGVPGLGGFRGTPHWPSHTDQFGTYYVRSPWR